MFFASLEVFSFILFISPFLVSASLSVPVNVTACAILNSQQNIFYASDAYACLRSVPFNQAVATRFIGWLLNRLEFQTTTAYLRAPPSTYRQPAVNLEAELDKIQDNLDRNGYENQYEFEAAVQRVIFAAHDSHLYLDAGALSVFSFLSPISIASISIDGQQAPKLYVIDDIDTAQTNWSGGQPSPIKTINGQNSTDFMKSFAKENAIGNLEPHADWNQLMSSSVTSSLGRYSIFESGVTFYPGDTLTVIRENGSVVGPYKWLAFYNPHGPTGPLMTGGDFYNFFVLGLLPASYNSADASLSNSRRKTRRDSLLPLLDTNLANDTNKLSGWLDSAYPEHPDIMQNDLGFGGYVTGYFFRSTKRAVLSIPSFSMDPNDPQSFSDTITAFIKQSQQLGMKQVVIDLQANRGGNTMQAIDAFKQFFPGVNPYTGTRMRSHSFGNAIGQTFTNYFNEHPPNNAINPRYYDMVQSEWVASTRLDTAGNNYTSWNQYTGENLFAGDTFTNVQQYNLSSFVFDVLYSGGIEVYGYPDRQVENATSPFSPEDIIILTDGLCASDCALFLDLMQRQGVRIVVAGGQPTDGPMQAAGGTRGAELYDTSSLDDDIFEASKLSPNVNASLLSLEQPIWVISATVNLRDQLRPDDTEPLQFKYQPATCRIFYTPSTWTDFTQLWNYAADAIWKNSSLCVPGSTGHPYYTPSYSGSNSTTLSRRAPRTIRSASLQPRAGSSLPSSSSSAATGSSISSTGASTSFLGDACPANQIGRPFAAGGSRFECRSVQFCTVNNFNQKSYSNRPVLVTLSGFYTQKAYIDQASTKAYNCPGQYCVPLGRENPPFQQVNGNSRYSGQWWVPCYCQLSKQRCQTRAETLLHGSSDEPAAEGDGDTQAQKSEGVTHEQWLNKGDIGGIINAGLAPWKR
ncbi:hypothetical protein EV356DRAFT_518580 [Viridothelium virens]|uniref:Uncharacterized protein n=1 Tax=Viridothelium virens TaxID=1048519 RepID=A0A6A6H0Q7_VIRVR|nr:hypothetical protein EV356DRAFT_518580 [Viridothelium virens]